MDSSLSNAFPTPDSPVTAHSSSDAAPLPDSSISNAFPTPGSPGSAHSSSEAAPLPTQPPTTPDSSVTTHSSSGSSPLPVGFIGLSHIGRIIARKLLDANIPLIIFDKYVQSVRSAKVTKSDCPADVILKCKITFCCEPEESCVKTMVFGRPKGVLEGLDEFKNVMHSSEMNKGFVMLETISPELSVKINTAISAKNGLYVEAPVIGNLEMAENNSVKIIATGDHSIYRECEQYFRIFAKKTVFLGDQIGRALNLKVLHSMMEGTMNEALKEILTLAKKKEISTDLLLKRLEGSDMSSPALMDKACALLQSKKETTADIKALRKDMAIVTLAADRHNFQAPIASMFSQTLIVSQIESEQADALESAGRKVAQLRSSSRAE